MRDRVLDRLAKMRQCIQDICDNVVHEYGPLQNNYRALERKYTCIFSFLEDHVKNNKCHLMRDPNIKEKVAKAKKALEWKPKEPRKAPAKENELPCQSPNIEAEVASPVEAEVASQVEAEVARQLSEDAIIEEREKAAVAKYIKEQQPEVIEQVEKKLRNLWKKHFDTEKNRLRTELADFKKDMLVKFNKKLTKIRDRCKAIVCKSTTTSSTVTTTVFDLTTDEQQQPSPPSLQYANTDLDCFFSSWSAVEELFSSPENVEQIEWLHLRDKLNDKDIEDYHRQAIGNIKTELSSLPWPLNKNLLPFSKSYSKIKNDEKTKDEIAHHYNWFEQAANHWCQDLAKDIFLDWMNNLTSNITPAMWKCLISAKNNEPQGWATASIKLIEKKDKKVYVDEYFLLCLFWWLHPQSRQVSGKTLWQTYRNKCKLSECSITFTSEMKQVKKKHKQFFDVNPDTRRSSLCLDVLSIFPYLADMLTVKKHTTRNKNKTV